MPATTQIRPDLSRSRILDAAQSIIDHDGESALTFRRLGLELGADPTAAYRYFRNKDDLLLALGDQLLGKAMDAAEPRDNWRAELREVAQRSFQALVQHPRLAVLVSVRVTQGAQEARAIEHVLATLAGAGFSTEEAVIIWRALADTVLAWAGFAAAFLALPEEVRARDAAAWGTTYRRLPADQYPHIAAAGPYLDGDYNAFNDAIELLLDGVQNRFQTRSQEAR